MRLLMIWRYNLQIVADSVSSNVLYSSITSWKHFYAEELVLVSIDLMHATHLLVSCNFVTPSENNGVAKRAFASSLFHLLSQGYDI
jgi:hypothetical protein